MRQKRLRFRRKQHGRSALRPVQRLDADTIAEQVDDAAARVRNHDGKHAIEPFEHPLESPALVEREDDLGISAGAETVAVALELGLVVVRVVDLAVEEQRGRAVGAGHRLVSTGRKVDDLQPVETQRGVRDAAAQRQAECAAIVRTAMTNHVRHRPEHAGVGRRTIQVDEPRDSAHL